MKRSFIRRPGFMVTILVVLFSFTGCYETHYYHHYNHHTRGWYDRRHVPPPAGVNFEIDVETRHHRHHDRD